ISYQTGDGDLYFSGNTGASWTVKSSNPGFPNASTWDKITDVAVNPTNSSIVWASFGGFNNGVKVVMSTNTGDSWTNMSANLPNVPINCLAIDNSNGVYAGTDIGVFYRGPSMSNWMPWSNKLPNVPVTELVIFDDGVNKKIRASTFGRGVWQGDLAGTCDAAVVVTGNLEGIQHYEAGTSISSTSFIQGGAGTFVSFKAGSYINLTEGFNVVDDSEFLGFINPCGQGGIPSAQDNTGINRADPNSAIIVLRRMWDAKDGLPFGSIEIMEHDQEHAHVKLKLKDGGNIQIVAARPIQERLATLYNKYEKPGSHVIDLDLASLPKEFHYLLLFYEGKLIHFQELDLSN
ncbi:MAG TPA: 3-coathanger stack domain-containing protein, partial [Allocoleopsis sp.]